jgi:hypothetical protein
VAFKSPLIIGGYKMAQEKMNRDDALSFIRWVAYEFSTCLATETEAEKLSEAMRVLQLSNYDHELKRFT